MRELGNEFIQRKEFDRFVQDFVGAIKAPTQEDIDRFIGEIKTLERFILDNKRFYILFDHSKFYLAYVSENIKKDSGYSAEYILNQGLFFLFQRIHWKQLTVAYKVNKWGLNFQKIIGKHVPVQTFEIWICGWKFKDKWRSWRTVIIKQKILAATKDNDPLLSFLETEDITNIYKSDVVWHRISCLFQGKRTTRVYFSSGPKKESSDILSSREIEILQLVVQQKSNQKISELLNISKHTVERHRKNMIARVGATDITALIRIAQIVKVL